MRPDPSPLTFAALVSVLAAFCTPSGIAADKEKKPPRSNEILEFGVLVEHIKLDQPTATKLIRDYRGDGNALRKKLQGLVDAKKAELIESAYLIAREGKRAKIESIYEYIYPTEYDPPEIPTKVSADVARGADLSTPSNPTAFDVRNVGNTLEVELKVELKVDPGNGLISLNLSPEVVEYVGDTTYGNGLAEAKQPAFHVIKSYANVVVRSDKYALLGLQTPRDPNSKGTLPKRDQQHRVFVMVRAAILENPEKQKKK